MILDFHTHNINADNALISVSPVDFAPGGRLGNSLTENSESSENSENSKPFHSNRFYTVGVHPWDTQQCTASTLELLNEVATRPQVIAIGETGLDNTRGADLDVQQRIFLAHIELSEKLAKPLVIHLVHTSQLILKYWKTSASHRTPWAIHGMRGNANVARPLLDDGFYLSFGEYFNSETLRITPLDRLLIETDAADISIDAVAAKVATALDLPVEKVKKIAADNASRLLGL
jgi:TatD DNase family protein